MNGSQLNKPWEEHSEHWPKNWSQVLESCTWRPFPVSEDLRFRNRAPRAAISIHANFSWGKPSYKAHLRLFLSTSVVKICSSIYPNIKFQNHNIILISTVSLPWVSSVHRLWLLELSLLQNSCKQYAEIAGSLLSISSLHEKDAVQDSYPHESRYERREVRRSRRASRGHGSRGSRSTYSSRD